MRVYLAASYHRKNEIAGYIEEIEKSGITVDAPWLLPDEERVGGTFNTMVDDAKDTVPVDEGRVFAEADWNAIARSDVLVAFAETPYSGVSRGGRHVELGLALAWGKKVIIVGPRENVFMTLPQIHHFWQWGQDVVDEISNNMTRLGPYTVQGQHDMIMDNIAHVPIAHS